MIGGTLNSKQQTGSSTLLTCAHHSFVVLQGHTKWITSVAWEPAHKRLPSRKFVSGSQDKTVCALPCQTSALRKAKQAKLHAESTLHSHSPVQGAVAWRMQREGIGMRPNLVPSRFGSRVLA